MSEAKCFSYMIDRTIPCKDSVCLCALYGRPLVPCSRRSRAVTDQRERVARAIDEADLGYRLELTRLVDGISTYTLTIKSDPEIVQEFSDTEEAYDYVRTLRCNAKADAAIAAMDDGWQDIESAPRDGTWILAYWAGNVPRHVTSQDVTYWNEGWRPTWPYANADAEYRDPTHWRPLPPPPKEAAIPSPTTPHNPEGE